MVHLHHFFEVELIQCRIMWRRKASGDWIRIAISVFTTVVLNAGAIVLVVMENSPFAWASSAFGSMKLAILCAISCTCFISIFLMIVVYFSDPGYLDERSREVVISSKRIHQVLKDLKVVPSEPVKTDSYSVERTYHKESADSEFSISSISERSSIARESIFARKSSALLERPVVYIESCPICTLWRDSRTRRKK